MPLSDDDFTTLSQEINNQILDLYDKAKHVVKLLHSATKLVKQLDVARENGVKIGSENEEGKLLSEKIAAYKKTLILQRADFEAAVQSAQRLQFIDGDG